MIIRIIIFPQQMIIFSIQTFSISPSNSKRYHHHSELTSLSSKLSYLRASCLISGPEVHLIILMDRVGPVSGDLLDLSFVNMRLWEIAEGGFNPLINIWNALKSDMAPSSVGWSGASSVMHKFSEPFILRHLVLFCFFSLLEFELILQFGKRGRWKVIF